MLHFKLKHLYHIQVTSFVGQFLTICQLNTFKIKNNLFDEENLAALENKYIKTFKHLK